MDRITPGRAWPLFDIDASRRLEAQAAATLPPHTLMQRAGLAVARLALALAPHARTTWVACGPGNNGGDGFEAAMHLQAWGRSPVVTWLGEEARLPADAAASLARAREAGVTFAEAPPAHWDLAIDALFGLGAGRPLEGAGARWRAAMAAGAAPVLAVDLPSGLDADTGQGEAVRAHHTLSLLTLKPGLFTAHGRDLAGQVWFDDLGVAPSLPPTARLSPAPRPAPRPHASHKGSWGDVAVVGGAPGMTGAALLAASAALHAGAGRVFVGLLDGGRVAVDTSQPELMLRPVDTLDFADLHLACGCGGGDTVRGLLPRALASARSLVLDADALNAIAADPHLQALLRARGARHDRPTVLTPHPLEAARLLGLSAAQVQADRLAAARALADRFHAVALLKGSGTVIAAPGRTPQVNPTGNARLASAGTGDVLAGVLAARLAAGEPAFEAASDAAWTHGAAADHWPEGEALTAGALARRI
ncbi:NAD(P)H-hydrate dehydratase [Ramlibacter sp. MAHUQ-53]|uniref:NAD(P)H-hydrate dehydratase n=1 Tax=unclassified Ramlibacter TaxID=2617605 RepID=UPI00362AE02C